MKPGVSLARAGVLPIALMSAVAFSMLASLVRSPWMTSTKAMSGGGLKKCRSEHALLMLCAAAMAVTLNDEVLVASRVSGAADGVQLLEDVALEFEFFRRRLDHQRRSPWQSSRLVDGVKAVENFFFLLGADLAALAAAFEKILHFPHAHVDELLLDIVEESLKAGLGGDLGDARAHGAGAEDGDFFSFVSHDVSCFGLRSLGFRVQTQNAELETIHICR